LPHRSRHRLSLKCWKPASIKGILVSTASRLVNFPAIRQGFGVLNAGLAVKEAIKEKHFFYYKSLASPNIEDDKIVFLHHDDNAQSIYLSGDFNNWDSSETSFTLGKDGIWRAEILNPEPGKYCYKFVVNGENWIEDHLNGMKEEDGYGGFNSILQVK
jgi:serine protease AprX